MGAALCSLTARREISVLAEKFGQGRPVRTDLPEVVNKLHNSEKAVHSSEDD